MTEQEQFSKNLKGASHSEGYSSEACDALVEIKETVDAGIDVTSKNAEVDVAARDYLDPELVKPDESTDVSNAKSDFDASETAGTSRRKGSALRVLAMVLLAAVCSMTAISTWISAESQRVAEFKQQQLRSTDPWLYYMQKAWKEVRADEKAVEDCLLAAQATQPVSNRAYESFLTAEDYCTFDLRKREELLKRALDLSEKLVGPDNPRTALVINRLVENNIRQEGEKILTKDQLERSTRPLIVRSLKILETSPTFIAALNDARRLEATLNYVRDPAEENVLNNWHKFCNQFPARGEILTRFEVYRDRLKVQRNFPDYNCPEGTQWYREYSIEGVYSSNPDDSQARYRAQCNVLKKAFGPQSIEYAVSLENLAAALVSGSHRQDQSLAIELKQQARKIRQDAARAPHVTLTVPKQYYQGIAEFPKRVYGERSPEYLVALHVYIDLLEAQQYTAEAQEGREELERVYSRATH